MTKITIGARGSKLSLAYVVKVKELLIKNNHDLKEENINFKAIKTSGDLNLSKNISEIGGKNLFCKEIEESLLKKEIDIAVHSLKDMDSFEENNLVIGAYLKRNDPRDVIVLKKDKSLNNDIYNLSDDKPASNIEVVKYACNLINFKLPKIISFDELEEGMLKDFYKDSKKVSNKKIKNIFKLKLIYPTYKEGLKVNI